MSGINWRASTRETFEKIVEILLGREFGLRGHAVNGRGGDEGIDYDVDDAKIIFQLKFFPDGFPTSGTRRTQISRSFKEALKHDPDEWFLVVPANLTPHERRFVTGLGKGKRVKISIRDETWLDDQLMQAANKDLLDHYLYASDIDYLHARAEVFKNNPVIRDAGDLDNRVRAVSDAVDLVDPNWTFDFASVGGEIVKTLVPKDPAAPGRAPITITFTAVVPADSPQRKALDDADAYGYTSEIRLPGEMIRDYQVHGTRLLQSGGDVAELRLGPIPGASNWQPGELVLTGTAGERLGVFLVDACLRSQANKGSTYEIAFGEVLTLTLRVPFDLADQDAGNVHFSFNGAAGRPTTELFEVADFIVKLGASATCVLRVNDQQVVGMNSARTSIDLVDQFRQLRLLADDLRVIEAEANTKFRFPARVEARERVDIRNVRLMLEGHCVADPTANCITAQLSGDRDEALDQLLTTDPRWLLVTTEPGQFEILGQTIVLPQLSYAGYVFLAQEELDAIGQAFDDKSAYGHPVTMRMRPGDRVRMFLPDRRDPNLPVDITPWNVEGIYQMGLDSEGERFDTNTEPTTPGLDQPHDQEGESRDPVADITPQP